MESKKEYEHPNDMECSECGGVVKYDEPRMTLCETSQYEPMSMHHIKAVWHISCWEGKKRIRSPRTAR